MDARLKWLSIRESELEERLLQAQQSDKETVNSGSVEFIGEELEQVKSEIVHLVSMQSTTPRSICMLSPEQLRWKLVGKAMCEACRNENMQAYIRSSFELLHAQILRTISPFQLMTVRFLLTSGHLSSQTVCTLFRFCP